jgi:alpha-mannosidase
MMAEPLKLIIPSTHVDIAWKKDEDEMSEVLEDMLIRLIDMLESNSELTYVLEQAYLFRYLHKRRPHLVENLKKFIENGQLEVAGGMASSVETNTINGESIIKNYLIGKSWFGEVLGGEAKTGWLIDTFGINAQMPQLLKLFGLSYLFANRLGADKMYSKFTVCGLDGTEMAVIGRDIFSQALVDDGFYFKFLANWKMLDELIGKAEKGEIQGRFKLMMPYTENEIVNSRRLIQYVKEYSGSNKWKFVLPRDLIGLVDTEAASWPKLNADMNPEFTGTFSTRYQIRTLHRRIENELIEIETLINLVPRGTKAEWTDRIEQMWWELAYVQSHDVFSGSHPTKVFNTTIKKLKGCGKIIEEIKNEYFSNSAGEKPCNNVSGSVCMFLWKSGPPSALPFVYLHVPGIKETVRRITIGNKEIPFRLEGDTLKLFAEIPEYAMTPFLVDFSAEKEKIPTPKITKNCTLDNKKITLALDERSGVCGMGFSGEKAVKNIVKKISLVIQEDQGGFQIEEPKGSEIESSINIESLEYSGREGCVEKAVLRGVFPPCPGDEESPPLKWSMDFILNDGAPFLELIVKLDWRGEKSRIRLKLETGIDSAYHFDEIPFGIVKRGSYRDRGTACGEWPVYRFSCMEQNGFGVGLVNFGSGGVEYSGGEIRTSLLRAPYASSYDEFLGLFPDETSSQHGLHEFRFLIVPYMGSWREAELPALAAAANSPAFYAFFSGGKYEGGTMKSCIKISSPNVLLSSVTGVKDDSKDILVRLYEASGEETTADLTVNDAVHFWESDIYGNKLTAMKSNGDILSVIFRGYEIRTLRVHRV